MATLADELLEALKDRIKNEVPANQFDPQTWNKTALGLFFPADDSLVQHMRITSALRGVFEPILIAHQMGVTESRWDTYFFGISVSSTPNSAVNRVLIVFGG